MKCPKCGNDFEGKFCPYCGTKLDTEYSKYGYSATQNTTGAYTNRKSTKLPIIGLILSIVGVITLFFGIGILILIASLIIGIVSLANKSVTKKIIPIVTVCISSITIFLTILLIAIGSSTNSTADEINEKPEAVQGSDIQTNNISEFETETTDGQIKLLKYIGNDEVLTIYPTYEIGGQTYNTDLSNFMVHSKDVKCIIFEEGIEEIQTATFNSVNVEKIFFPKSMTTVYDYTLAYLHPDDGEQIEIYYAGTQDDWNNIFKHYERTKAEDTEPGEEMGKAIADKINQSIGVSYDASLFVYYFSAKQEDMN